MSASGIMIVTGGSRGIGAATALLAAKNGWSVAVNYTANSLAADEVVRQIRSAGGHAIAVQADVADEAQVMRMYEHIDAKMGRLSGLVNNAGVNDRVGLSAGPAAFSASLERNLVHYYTMAHFIVPHLIKTQGAIVNVASKTALTGQGDTSGYCAAKGGQLALTREWAISLAAHNIRVNAVLPAEVMTTMYADWIATFDNPEEKQAAIESKIPLGQRMSTPTEIANTIVFLLSSAASHTTGQWVHVDGGYVHLDRAYSTR